MGKKSRQKNERLAMAGLKAMRHDIGSNGLRFGVGIEPASPQPILLQFKAGEKTVLPTCWDVASARAMANSLLKYCEIAERAGPNPSPEVVAKIIHDVKQTHRTPLPPS